VSAENRGVPSCRNCRERLLHKLRIRFPDKLRVGLPDELRVREFHYAPWFRG